MVDGLNFEERAHERSVIPAEISALQEVGVRSMFRIGSHQARSILQRALMRAPGA
jgi:hypothetical protein